MYCGNCGTQLPDGASRCHACGWTPAIPAGNGGNTPPPTQYGSNNYPGGNQNYSNAGQQNYNSNSNANNAMPVDRTVYDGTVYGNSQTVYNGTSYGNTQSNYGETVYQNGGAPYGGYDDTYRGDVYRGDGSRYDDVPSSGKSGSKKIVVILVAVIVLLVGALGAGAWYILDSSGDKDNNNKTVTSDAASVSSGEEAGEKEAEEAEEAKDKGKKTEDEENAKEEKRKEIERMSNDFAPSINSILDAQNMSSSVGVAIIDNIDGKVYSAGAHNFSFSAWGFYLPIYLAYTAEFGEGSAAGIMSSDPATCNQAANNAIDALGGLSSMNHYLRTHYNLSYTSYSRRFGQAASPGMDNYTSASEAVRLVSDLYNSGRSGKFSYSPSSFGISVPYGATMYSQIGTENRNVKKCLNLFAVVRGNYSNYCVVILTKDTVSRTGITNTLLSHIHTTMEAIHQ